MKIIRLLSVAVLLAGCAHTEPVYRVDSGNSARTRGNTIGITNEGGKGPQLYGSYGASIDYSKGGKWNIRH